jgi:hypothetical protein
MKYGIISVLALPYDNKLEVRVMRGKDFNTKPQSIRVYSADYSNPARAKSMAMWAGQLNALVLMKMVDNKAFMKSSIA